MNENLNNREYLPGVTIRDLTPADREKFKGLNFDSLLESEYKLIEWGNLYCAISKYDFEAYGKDRLAEVVYSEYSKVCEEHFLKVDFAKIANDITFNKPFDIRVKFLENVPGTNESVFKSEDGKHYIRQDSERESCTKWFSAFKHNGRWEDNASIRPNITFIMGNEKEKVTFSGWNGSGVYPGEYNKAFAYNAVHKVEKVRLDDVIATAQNAQKEQQTIDTNKSDKKVESVKEM